MTLVMHGPRAWNKLNGRLRVPLHPTPTSSTPQSPPGRAGATKSWIDHTFTVNCRGPTVRPSSLAAEVVVAARTGSESWLLSSPPRLELRMKESIPHLPFPLWVQVGKRDATNREMARQLSASTASAWFPDLCLPCLTPPPGLGPVPLDYVSLMILASASSYLGCLLLIQPLEHPRCVPTTDTGRPQRVVV